MLRRPVVAIVVALLLSAAFVRLGVWQLARRDQRRAFNALVERRMHAPAVALSELPPDTSAVSYRTVRVSGTFDYAREQVLTSRSHQGSPGVYLFTPLRLAGTDTAILVNRGWVYSADGASVDQGRWRTDRAAPASDSIAGEVASGDFLAYAQTFPPPAKTPIGVRERPHAVRALDHGQLAKRLPYPLAPFYLTALPDQAPKSNAPARIAQPSLDEGPHLSYAIQWFSFAIVAVVGMSFFVRSSRTQEGPEGHGRAPRQ